MSSLSTEYAECGDIIKKVLLSKENISQNNSGSYNTSRYCEQNKFNVLFCGGIYIGNKTVSNANQPDRSVFENVRVLPPMREERCSPKAVCLKGEVYVFGGREYEYSWINSVEKYSPSTNTWKKIAEMYDDR